MPATISPRRKEQVATAALEAVGVQVTPEVASILFDWDEDGEPPRETIDTGAQQAGKSTIAGGRTWVDVTTKVPLNPRDPTEPWRYWYVLPSYRTPPKELDYLNAWATRAGILDRYQRSEGAPSRLTMLGGRVVVETRSGQNPEQIASEACDGVCIVEAGQQPEEVVKQAQTRVVARHGWVNQCGTLEDDDAHPRWAHYEKTALAWMNNPKGHSQRMHRLPMWANRTVAPGGEHDPEIERLRQRYDARTFARRVAATPTGVANPAYPVLQEPGQVVKRLRSLNACYVVCLHCSGSGLRNNDACRECGGMGKVLPWTWIDGAGGIDYGMGLLALGGAGHISAVVVLTLASTGDVWVRACRVITSGDVGEITAAQDEFTRRFKVYRWGLDPLQSWAAALSQAGTLAVKMGAGSRDGRIGMVRRRLNNLTLFFDQDGEGVPELLQEMVGVRYVVNGAGQLVLRRLEDDRSAALEDAVEVLDAQDKPLSLSLEGQKVIDGAETATPRENTFTLPESGDKPTPLLFGLPGQRFD